MFVSIRTKLIILLVLANTLMISVMLVLNAASFNRGFSDYVIERETRRLKPLLENIAQQYEQQGNWNWLRWDSPVWHQTLRQSVDPQALKEIGRGHISKPIRGFFERLTIKDAKTDKIILGRKNQKRELIWIEIKGVDDETDIAYLGFEPNSRLDAEFDEIFSDRLTKQLVFIGIIGLFIAAMLAVPFASWLVKPIRRLNKAMGKMTSGELDVSVPVDRKDELGTLANDFNRLAKVLRQNQQDRQTWVSDIAHELRTPVAVLIADIEAAQDGIRKVDDAWLKSLHIHSFRLTQLVNDLHQLSQSDAGTLNYRFEPLDLVDLVDDSLAHCSASFSQANLLCNWQMPEDRVWIRGDATRLSQLLSNLAQNSLRYTDCSESAPGSLKVSLKVTPFDVELIWEDSSPGVGEKDLALLFDRLYRVDESRSRDSGGSGLGLAIVKNIVEAHEATIGAHHSEFKGLKIIVQFTRLKEE